MGELLHICPAVVVGHLEKASRTSCSRLARWIAVRVPRTSIGFHCLQKTVRAVRHTLYCCPDDPGFLSWGWVSWRVHLEGLYFRDG